MAIHTFEDAMAKFDELVSELDANIVTEVLEEIGERVVRVLDDRQTAPDLDDDDEIDDDGEDDDDFDDDDELDDDDDDEGQPS